MHIFSPANVMKLLEVVRGAKTAPDVLATVMDLAKKIKKVAVVAGVTYGFIGNRMLMPRRSKRTSCCWKARRRNRSTASMSPSACRWGRSRWPTSPASISAGIATPTASRTSATRSLPKGAGAEEAGGLLRLRREAEPHPVSAGRRDHPGMARQDRHPQQRGDRRGDRRADAVHDGQRRRADPGEGKAQRASDVDVVWIYGYGWPVYRGGPDVLGAERGAGEDRGGAGEARLHRGEEPEGCRGQRWAVEVRAIRIPPRQGEVAARQR